MAKPGVRNVVMVEGYENENRSTLVCYAEPVVPNGLGCCQFCGREWWRLVTLNAGPEAHRHVPGPRDAEDIMRGHGLVVSRVMDGKEKTTGFVQLDLIADGPQETTG